MVRRPPVRVLVSVILIGFGAVAVLVQAGLFTGEVDLVTARLSDIGTSWRRVVHGAVRVAFLVTVPGAWLGSEGLHVPDLVSHLTALLGGAEVRD